MNAKRFSIFAGLLVFLGFAFSVYFYWSHNKDFTDALIVQDIKKLSSIFDSIKNNAGIQSFEHQKNYIDFLTVKDFIGSEIGSMNLNHPEKWQGPYVDDNPTVQDKYYLVVQTNNGYFITPGEGVKLANGKVIGKNILLDKDADVRAMISDKSYLLSEYGPLAVEIKF